MAFEDTKLTLVETLDDALDFLSWLGGQRRFLAVDVETTGLNVGCDVVRLVQFGDAEQGWALDYRDWRGIVKTALDRYDRPMVAHNLLYDSKMLKADGIVLPQRLMHDTMVMGHLKNPAFRMDLKGMAVSYVDKRAAAGQEYLKAAMSQQGWTWATVPIDAPAYWLYSTLDTCLTAMLAEQLYDDVVGRYREAYELELAVIHCLRDAELTGMLVDETYRAAAAWKLRQEIAELVPQIPLANPGSDLQLREYLLALGAPLFVRTEKGQLAVDKEVLSYLEPHYPICGPILQYRQKRKLLDSYIEKFAEVGSNEQGLAVGGVLRPSARPLGARTGRMSVTDPPLQTLPRGRVVRDAIVARPGHALLMADFAGMELRALASDAREQAMLEAFARGEDMHGYVASQLYGPGYTKQQRTICKNGQFAMIYGSGPDKFAVTAKIDVNDARTFFDLYKQMFPGVDQYMHDMTTSIYAQAGGRRGWGNVELIDGRHLRVEADKAYASVNYRIQGSCAVVTKQKIVALDNAGLGPYFRLAVHDELIYEPPLEYVAEARHIISQVMPDTHNFPGVTLAIESDVVDRWGQHYRDDFEPYIPTVDPAWLEAA